MQLLLALLISQGRLKITIDDPAFRPIPIAVAEMNDGKVVTETLRNDLEFSFVFTSVNPKSFLGDTHQDWVNVGAQGVVRGQYSFKGPNVAVVYRFYDIASQRDVITKTYERPKGEERLIAHDFADELVAYFTGQRGVFSTQIAFAAKGPNNASNIWVMDFDGSNVRMLPLPSKLNLLPAWDRSGREVYFTSFARDNPDLYAWNGKSARIVSQQHGLNSGAAISPDGSRVAMTLSKDGNSEIYVGATDGSNLKRLTDNFWIDTSPSWSPDGKQLAYVSSKTGNPHIYVMNADGSGSKRITFQGKYNQTPDWSPKGNVIAFTARDERYKFDIFTVDPTNNEIKRLTQDQGNNEEPSFSPDGRLIAFISDRAGGRRVWVMNADGTKPRQVYTGGADCETPAWSPRLR